MSFTEICLGDQCAFRRECLREERTGQDCLNKVVTVRTKRQSPIDLCLAPREDVYQ